MSMDKPPEDDPRYRVDWSQFGHKSMNEPSSHPDDASPVSHEDQPPPVPETWRDRAPLL